MKMAKVINHISHGLADLAGHHVPGNLPRDGAPKRVTGIEVAHGHRTRSPGATITGPIKTTPGWGNAGVQDGGHPLSRAPGSKRTILAQPVIGHRSRTSQHSSDLGEAILKTAFSRSDSADCVAHGRNPDGSRK